MKILNKLLNRETILYLFFGVLTTIINFVMFAVFDRILGNHYYLFANLLAFILATAFAFVTNKRFVFMSKNWELGVVTKEAISFVSTRLFTFLLEEAGLLFAVEILSADQFLFFGVNGKMIAKIILAFLAVVLNYLFSKFLIFKRVEEKNGNDSIIEEGDLE